MDSQTRRAPGYAEGNVSGPQPAGGRTQSGDGQTIAASRILKRNVLQPIEQGLQMFHSAGKRTFVTVSFFFLFLDVYTCLCLCYRAFSRQPSILLSLRRKRERYQALLFLFN